MNILENLPKPALFKFQKKRNLICEGPEDS